jgi:hypothetical protein
VTCALFGFLSVTSNTNCPRPAVLNQRTAPTSTATGRVTHQPIDQRIVCFIGSPSPCDSLLPQLFVFIAPTMACSPRKNDFLTYLDRDMTGAKAEENAPPPNRPVFCLVWVVLFHYCYTCHNLSYMSIIPCIEGSHQRGHHTS